jgi:hypothetical protein
VPLVPAPARLSHAEKDALIAALTTRLAAADERIAAQDARIAALEARLEELTRPPKTPGNSSKPPSQGQKQDRQAPGTDRPPRKGRPGVGRALYSNPDRVVDRRLTTCPMCDAVFPDTSQTPQQIYKRIELPPVRPDVTQIRLFGGRCACCGERATAEAPAGLKPGSPFGQSIAAMGGLSTLRPCHRHGATSSVDGRTLLAVHQRGARSAASLPRSRAALRPILALTRTGEQPSDPDRNIAEQRAERHGVVALARQPAPAGNA